MNDEERVGIEPDEGYKRTFTDETADDAECHAAKYRPFTEDDETPGPDGMVRGKGGITDDSDAEGHAAKIRP